MARGTPARASHISRGALRSRSGGRSRGLIAAAAAVLLALPATAGAEPIVSLGQVNSRPTAVTDGAGTLHVISRLDSGSSAPDALAYCRVPAGGTACSTAMTIGGFPDDVITERLLERPQDGALIAVVQGFDADVRDVIYVLVSIDGGATWSVPRLAGLGIEEIDEAALTPDGSAVDVVAAPRFNELDWQRVPIAAGVETRIVNLQRNANGSDSLQSSQPAVGTLSDGRTMVMAYGNRLGTRARILTGADPYANASWTRWRAVPELGGVAFRAGFGPSGTWALTQGPIAEHLYRVSRWNGRRFTRRVTIGGIGVPDIQTPAFAQDAGGRLHAAWQHFELCGRDRECIVYRRGGPRGFGPPIVYPLPDTKLRELSIAANAGGSGWIVYSECASISRCPAHAVPIVTPPRGSRVGSRRIRRLRVTLPVHYKCVPVGGRYVARLLVRGRRSGVRIRSVRFSFDVGQLPVTDRRAPYRHAYRLPFPAGTRHVARARVTYRRGGRTRDTSVGRQIVMCP